MHLSKGSAVAEVQWGGICRALAVLGPRCEAKRGVPHELDEDRLRLWALLQRGGAGNDGQELLAIYALAENAAAQGRVPLVPGADLFIPVQPDTTTQGQIQCAPNDTSLIALDRHNKLIGGGAHPGQPMCTMRPVGKALLPAPSTTAYESRVGAEGSVGLVDMGRQNERHVQIASVHPPAQTPSSRAWAGGGGGGGAHSMESSPPGVDGAAEELDEGDIELRVHVVRDRDAGFLPCSAKLQLVDHSKAPIRA